VIDHLGQRRPSGRTEALEAGELRLGGDARRAGRVDERAAVCDDRTGRPLGRRPARPGGLRRLGPQARRVRVESQDDLGLAPGDDVRQPVGEMRPGRRLSVVRQRKLPVS
jgi:hypothetical protein